MLFLIFRPLGHMDIPQVCTSMKKRSRSNFSVLIWASPLDTSVSADFWRIKDNFHDSVSKAPMAQQRTVSMNDFHQLELFSWIIIATIKISLPLTSVKFFLFSNILYSLSTSRRIRRDNRWILLLSILLYLLRTFQLQQRRQLFYQRLV